MHPRLANERGSIMIIVLLILLLLTIAGISSLDTTDIEIATSANSLIYKQNFYEADATATEATYWLAGAANEAGELSGSGGPNYFLQSSSLDRTDSVKLRKELASLRSSTTWDPQSATNPNNKLGSLGPNNSFRIMDYGASQGESTVLNNSMGGIKHEYVILGRYSVATGARRGEAIVEKGYRVRVK